MVSTMIVGCGYLGRRLGVGLVAGGGRVFGMVRSARRAAEIAGLGIEPVIADVLEPETCRHLPQTDRVCYCVGFDRTAGAGMRAVFVEGLRNVLDTLAPSVKRLVYASSTGVYGQTGGEWVDEDSPTEPGHQSGQVVLEAEGLVQAWTGTGSRECGHSAVRLRFAGLYGPGRIVRRSVLERGEPIPGDPQKYLNLIQIDDAARVAAAALDATEPEPVYLVADDRPVTRREYYSTAAGILHAPTPRFAPPDPGGVEATRDATNKRVLNSRMKRSFGIALLYPDIASGLAAALGSSTRDRPHGNHSSPGPLDHGPSPP